MAAYASQPKTKRKPSVGPWQRVCERVLEEAESEEEKRWLEEHMRLAVPKRWEKVGDVLILPGFDGTLVTSRPSAALRIGRAFGEALGVRVVGFAAKVSGELRTPDSFGVIWARDQEKEGREGRARGGRKRTGSCETTHVEGGIKYSLDVSRVMFASGNGTERMHFAKQMAAGEVVVDMFAGIGYFSVPLAVRSRALTLVCLEKNADSFAYLERNVAQNIARTIKRKPERPSPNSASSSTSSSVSLPTVVLIHGDNRIEGDRWKGTADRVLMGYIPSPSNFLNRALE
ncbi:MAG: hypothetical protein Q8P67_07930, partial [archaeon]|nr:hypothetical protein [archaeon]